MLYKRVYYHNLWTDTLVGKCGVMTMRLHFQVVSAK